MNKLIKQLKQLKHDPRLGAMDDAALAKGWERIAAAIGANEERSQPLPSVPEMYLAYVKWNLSHYVSRPVIAGAFSVVVVASGWLTTVSAADSLPGQRLYSIKMLTERTQLKLASLDRRAVLHTEFAGRRLQEASDLQETATDTDNAPLVREAIEAYKQEVTSAGEDLRQLKNEGGVEALATATSVQQGLQTIDNTLDEVAAGSATVEATQEALAAKEVTNEASDVATTVAVEVHEEQQTELSAYELTQMFKSELGQIEARQLFDLERIEVIRDALADSTIDYTNFTLPTAAELHDYEVPTLSVDDQLAEAMNNFAAGGFRTAFSTLQEIDSSLLEIEAKLAEIEIMIMNARAATPPPPVTEEAPESTELEAETSL